MDRYVPVKGIITRNQTFIPIWDERIEFVNTEDYGNIIRIKGEFKHYSSLSEFLYDLETKTFIVSSPINYYEENDYYKIGQSVYYSEDGSTGPLTESIIKEIQYQEFKIHNMIGKDIIDNHSYYLNDKKDLQINPNIVYSIKSWKPWYLMEDGILIKWSFQLHRKKEKKDALKK